MSYCNIDGYTCKYEKVGDNVLKLRVLSRMEILELEDRGVKVWNLPSCEKILGVDDISKAKNKIYIGINLSRFSKVTIDGDKIYAQHRVSGRIWEGRLLHDKIEGKCTFNIPISTNISHANIYEFDNACLLVQLPATRGVKANGLVVLGRREV